MEYKEETFKKLKKDTDALLRILQEFKYAGSIDPNFDVNLVIKTITNYQVILDSIRKEMEELIKIKNNLSGENEKLSKKEINDAKCCCNRI